MALKETDWDVVEGFMTQIRADILERNNNSTQNRCVEASCQLHWCLVNAGFDPKIIQGRVLIDDPAWEKIENEYTEEELEKIKNYECELDDVGANSECVELSSYCDIVCRPLHYWVELDGRILDVTGDQFNNEITEPINDIVMAPASEMPRYIKDAEVTSDDTCGSAYGEEDYSSCRKKESRKK